MVATPSTPTPPPPLDARAVLARARRILWQLKTTPLTTSYLDLVTASYINPVNTIATTAFQHNNDAVNLTQNATLTVNTAGITTIGGAVGEGTAAARWGYGGAAGRADGAGEEGFGALECKRS